MLIRLASKKIKNKKKEEKEKWLNKHKYGNMGKNEI